MGRKSGRRGQVDLFNFSFLDILACVIGLLIFILTIVVVSGGKSSSRQTAARLSNAEHLVEQARGDVDLAADRRKRDENLLSRRAELINDPDAAADGMRAQMRAMNNERDKLQDSAAAALARARALQLSAQAMNQSTTADPTLAEIQQQLRAADGKTADLTNQAADARRAAEKNRRRVTYTLPRLHEVERHSIWVEISGDRIWCLKSTVDFDVTPIDEESSRYTRRADAPGASISAIVSGSERLPPTIARYAPGNSLIEVVLRPDGYESFRRLRQWAWDHGYAVNWVTGDEDSVVLVRAGKAFAQ